MQIYGMFGEENGELLRNVGWVRPIQSRSHRTNKSLTAWWCLKLHVEAPTADISNVKPRGPDPPGTRSMFAIAYLIFAFILQQNVHTLFYFFTSVNMICLGSPLLCCQ
jgi:hypothetical protein